MNELRNDEARQPPQTGDALDKARMAGSQVRAAAVDLAGASTEALKDHASNAMDAAKDLAVSAQDRLRTKITEQKGLGADFARDVADAMRRAATQFDANVPLAGHYMREAADQVENAAEAVREGNLNDLYQGAQRFARRQPAAFFGLALLAGFGAVRFVKSSSGPLGPDREIGSSSTDDTRQRSDVRTSYDGDGRAI
jgi:hypothetical protein